MYSCFDGDDRDQPGMGDPMGMVRRPRGRRTAGPGAMLRPQTSANQVRRVVELLYAARQYQPDKMLDAIRRTGHNPYRPGSGTVNFDPDGSADLRRAVGRRDQLRAQSVSSRAASGDRWRPVGNGPAGSHGKRLRGRRVGHRVSRLVMCAEPAATSTLT